MRNQRPQVRILPRRPIIGVDRLSQNYSTTKGLIWPVLFCIFVIVILPVLLVDNAKYCRQSIIPCYPWVEPEEW